MYCRIYDFLCRKLPHAITLALKNEECMSAMHRISMAITHRCEMGWTTPLQLGESVSQISFPCPPKSKRENDTARSTELSIKEVYSGLSIHPPLSIELSIQQSVNPPTFKYTELCIHEVEHYFMLRQHNIWLPKALITFDKWPCRLP